MKLVACFTVFDGLELLPAAVDSILPHCDHVVICYQSVAHNGRMPKQSVRDFLFDKFPHAFDHASEIKIISYQPSQPLGTKENERCKHNMMVSHARALGGTHFLMMATDHFYDGHEIFAAKRLIEKEDYDVTLSAMYTYYKKPTWQLTPIETYYMPFICKINRDTRIERVRDFPVLVDPSVQISPLGKWVLFKPETVMLHHYSMCRNDIRYKFENAVSPWTALQINAFTAEFNGYDITENPGVGYFQGRKIEVVDDHFNLSPIFETV